MGVSGSNSRRCMAWAGVMPPKVLRGRALSSVATSSRRSVCARTGRCPWGSIGVAAHSVFVAAPLPGRVRVSEVDVHLGGHGDLAVLGQLGALDAPISVKLRVVAER